jgi:hypothetical protein
MMIYAVILDGYHRNTVMQLPQYLPEIHVPLSSSVKITDESVVRDILERITYKVVFHAVDREMALYSRTGNSMDFLNCNAVHPSLTGDLVGNRDLNYFVKVREE